MGDFTLGCLLGQYDKAQSFDVDSFQITTTNINSWIRSSAGNSMNFTTFPGNVHSSNQGLTVQIWSYGSPRDAILRYDYSENNDAYKRWFPDVTTHNIQTDLFARIGKGGFDDAIEVKIDNKASTFILADITDIQPYRLETTTHSGETGTSPFLDFDVDITIADSISLVVDDVLTQIDPIVIHPEYSFQEQARTIQTQHRSIGGEYRISVWEKYFAYSIPLRFLSDSHANLINWWWENKFNLVFTLNTSDSESMYITQIVNQQQPIGRRIRPYSDLWEGVIQLESIDKGSLVF